MKSKSLEHFWGDVIETLKEKKEVTDSMQHNRLKAAALTDLSQQIISSKQNSIGETETSKELDKALGLNIEGIQSAIQEQGDDLQKIDSELLKKRALLKKSIQQREQDLDKIHQLSAEIDASLAEAEQKVGTEIQELRNKLELVNEALSMHDPEKVFRALTVH